METVCTEWHCWLKKVEGEENCKFLTEDIMAAKNFNFKFSQNENFSAHDIAYLDANSLTKEKL